MITIPLSLFILLCNEDLSEYKIIFLFVYSSYPFVYIMDDALLYSVASTFSIVCSLYFIWNYHGADYGDYTPLSSIALVNI